MDVNQQLKVAKEAGVTVVHLNTIEGDPAYYEKDGVRTPVTISIYGIHSEQYRRVEERQRHRKLKPRTLTLQQAYEDNLERVVACTVSWEGLYIDGTPIPFSPANVEQVYRLARWIYDDVFDAMHDQTRFFTTSSEKPLSMSEQSPG